MLRIYLAGPMAGCTDEEIHGWRDFVINQTTGWAKCLDPTRRDYREVNIDTQIAKEIVELDKIDICQSDVVIVRVNPTKSSVGTHQECIFAWERGKEVLLIVDVGAYLSPWLMYHSTHIFHSYVEAVSYLREKYVD